MIQDSQTNKLYLADSLQRQQPAFFQKLGEVLKSNSILYELLPGTRDIWAVDYMPIQLAENKFVQFVYNPDYLQSKKWLKTISDVDAICAAMKLEPVKSDIVLDGGNVIKAADKVIMCDKVFMENPHYTRKQLINKLKELFEVEHLYFVPQQPKDFTGHADGMLRVLDNNTLLINDHSQESRQFQRAFKIALDNAGFDYFEIPYNPYNNNTYSQANGDYINFLQMKDFILLPIFGMKEDEIVVRLFEDLFKGYTIATIDSNEIADHGGVLNCISWNIKEE
jgi:agmatine deiminase